MTVVSSESQRVARNFSALVIASVLSKGLLFGWQIVLGNLFAPYEYGVYNTVSSLMAVSTSLISFGMAMIMIRDVARRPERLGDYWSAMLVMQTVLSLVAYVLVLLTAISSGYDSLIIAYAAIGGLSLMVDMVGNISFDLLLAQEKMTITSVVEVGHVLLRIVLAGWALSAGFGLLGVYMATISSGVLRSIALSSANVWLGHRPLFPINRGLAWGLLRDGLPLALAGFLSLAYQHADKLMTTAIIGAQFTGYLGPAFIINFGMIEIISTTILIAIFPMLSRSYMHSREAFSGWVARLARFMLMVALPITLVISIFARPIILTLYNPQYEPTAQLLQILIWSTLLMMVGNVFSRALLIQNRQRVSLLIRALCLGVNIGLNAFFLHTFRDPRGTAVATVIAEGLSLTLASWAFRSEGFAWRMVLPAMGRVLVLGMVSGLTMLLFGQIHWLIGAVGGLAVYAVGLVVGRVLAADDWALLYRFVGALPLGGYVQQVWGRIATVPAIVLD